MTTMLEILAKKRDDIVEFRDDREAAALLLEVRVLDMFAKNPHPGRQWFSMVCTTCDTHFIVGVVFTDFPGAEDNGYIAHCLPRSRFTADLAVDWAVANYKGNCDPRSIVEMFRPAVKASDN